MKAKKHFPLIVTGKKQDDMFVSSFAIAVKSIVHGQVFLDQEGSRDSIHAPFNELNPERLQKKRASFINTLCCWQDNTVIELLFNASPDMLCRMYGCIDIAYVIHVTADSEEVSKESALSRYLALVPLLSSHFPEVDFEPVYDPVEYTSLNHPFEVCYTLSVQRRTEYLSLESPFPRQKLGFIENVAIHNGPDIQKILHCHPWIPSLDDWSTLMETIMFSIDPMQIRIRLNPIYNRDTEREETARVVSDLEALLSTGSPAHIAHTQQLSVLRYHYLARLAELSGPCCRLGVLMTSAHPLDVSMGSLLGQSITGFPTKDDLYSGGFSCLEVPANLVKDVYHFYDQKMYSPTEAACAFRLPSPPLKDIPGLSTKRSRTNLAAFPDTRDREDSIILFENVHGSIRQPVFLGIADRLRHICVWGQTGTGKSTFIENMIMQDILAGRGLALIDPATDLADSILGKIPREREKDVIIFDTADYERPVGLNIFQYEDVRERDLIIDELYLTLDHEYDLHRAGGPIFESNMRGVCRILLPEKPRKNFHPTIVEFPLFYINKTFREWLVKTSEDPQANDFVKELERTGGDASLPNLSQYVTSKFNRFINDTTLRNIISQERTTFSFDDIMNNGKILIVKLNKGRFGPVVSSLLASQIVTRFKCSAMKRGNISPEERKPFFLYIDEAHAIPGENLMTLLSEARKFKLGLVLASQYASQFTQQRGKNNLLSAVLGNTGTIILYRLGQEDAKELLPVIKPCFNVTDIVSLPNWQGFARLQVSKDSLPPFSFNSIKDSTPYSDFAALRLRDISRKKYGRSKNDIEQQANLRRSCWS